MISNTSLLKLIDQNYLVCPHCNGNVVRSEPGKIVCNNCKNRYLLAEHQVNFLESKSEDLIHDKLDIMKNVMKRFYKLYNFLVYLVSPVFFHHPKFIDRSLKRLVKDHIERNSLSAINIGSGNTNISAQILNVDFMNYKNVNVICDIHKLPFSDNSLDCVINVAVLEHLEQPEIVIKEIYRVLRPGGLVYSYFPFIQGIHASPFDFSRRTDAGLKSLYYEFEITKIKPSGGPASGFLWIFQEFISLLLSFGIVPLYRFIHIVVMLLTFPIKYLDAVLLFHPVAGNISTGFTIIAKKKQEMNNQ